jgi:hypothetical protein
MVPVSMRTPSVTSRHRGPRLAIFAAILAVVVALTGATAAAHGHIPAFAGWHDAAPHGAAVHGDGPGSCSICRLAHETSSGPVALGTVSEPCCWVTPKAQDRSAFTAAACSRRRQPRAPPCLASC